MAYSILYMYSIEQAMLEAPLSITLTFKKDRRMVPGLDFGFTILSTWISVAILYQLKKWPFLQSYSTDNHYLAHCSIYHIARVNIWPKKYPYILTNPNMKISNLLPCFPATKK